MANTLRKMSNADHEQTLRKAFNDTDFSLNVNGFLAAIVGRKVILTDATTTISGDTQIIDFQENGISLYSYRLIYTDGTQAKLKTAERIS